MVLMEELRPVTDDFEYQPLSEEEAAVVNFGVDVYDAATPTEQAIATAYAIQERDRATTGHVNALAAPTDELAADIRASIASFTEALTELERPTPWLRHQGNVTDQFYRGTSYHRRREARSFVGEYITIDFDNFGVPAANRHAEAERLHDKQRRALGRLGLEGEALDEVERVSAEEIASLAPTARRRMYASMRPEERRATKRISRRVAELHAHQRAIKDDEQPRPYSLTAESY